MAGQKRPTESHATSSSKTGKWQVAKVTFERWQRQFERDYQTLLWLRCELEQDKMHVATLSCGACKKYECSVQSLKNFSRAWITGSFNQKVNNVIDHATSPQSINGTDASRLREGKWWFRHIAHNELSLHSCPCLLINRQQTVANCCRQRHTESLMCATSWQRRAYCLQSTLHCWNWKPVTDVCLWTLPVVDLQ